jgi:hypothetical protein
MRATNRKEEIMNRDSTKKTLALLAATLLAAIAGVAAPQARAADAELFTPPTMTEADWDALIAEARADGPVPVIVALDVPTRPEHALALGEQARQRAAIARARDAVLAGMESESRGRVRSAESMPLLSFSADERDLARLRRSKHVSSVTRDREVTLDAAIGRGESDGPQTPLGGTGVAGSGVAATSANGDSNQLSEWWDWYRIGVDKARGWGHTGSGQLVAVIDSGVDRNHGWLSGKVVNEACFSQASPGAQYGGCPNGLASQLGYGAAAPCGYSYLCAHGTHVAHTAAGTWGVASGAKIMAIQVFHQGASGDPTYWESDVIWALKHVYDQRGYYRIAAVNMSIGGTDPNGFLYGGYCDNGPSDGTTNATYLAGWVNALKSVGIATVVSSGNDNSSTGTRRPSCIANAISVGNTTLDPFGYDAVYGYVAGGSNSNATVDLLAPGTDICSAVPSWLDNDGNANGIGCSWIGTSMAAPHVAGAFAVARAFRPSLGASAATVDHIDSALRRSGTSVTDSRNGLTRTRIHVANMLYNV